MLGQSYDTINSSRMWHLHLTIKAIKGLDNFKGSSIASLCAFTFALTSRAAWFWSAEQHTETQNDGQSAPISSVDAAQRNCHCSEGLPGKLHSQKLYEYTIRFRVKLLLSTVHAIYERFICFSHCFAVWA